jgi:hypothetical protein
VFVFENFHKHVGHDLPALGLSFPEFSLNSQQIPCENLFLSKNLFWVSLLIHSGQMSQDTWSCDFSLFLRPPSSLMYINLHQEDFSQDGTLPELSKVW